MRQDSKIDSIIQCDAEKLKSSFDLLNESVKDFINYVILYKDMIRSAL